MSELIVYNCTKLYGNYDKTHIPQILFGGLSQEDPLVFSTRRPNNNMYLSRRGRTQFSMPLEDNRNKT